MYIHNISRPFEISPVTKTKQSLANMYYQLRGMHPSKQLYLITKRTRARARARKAALFPPIKDFLYPEQISPAVQRAEIAHALGKAYTERKWRLFFFFPSQWGNEPYFKSSARGMAEVTANRGLYKCKRRARKVHARLEIVHRDSKIFKIRSPFPCL